MKEIKFDLLIDSNTIPVTKKTIDIKAKPVANNARGTCKINFVK